MPLNSLHFSSPEGFFHNSSYPSRNQTPPSYAHSNPSPPPPLHNITKILSLWVQLLTERRGSSLEPARCLLKAEFTLDFRSVITNTSPRPVVILHTFTQFNSPVTVYRLYAHISSTTKTTTINRTIFIDCNISYWPCNSW